MSIKRTRLRYAEIFTLLSILKGAVDMNYNSFFKKICEMQVLVLDF